MKKLLVLLSILVLAGLAYLGIVLARHGFSAREKPSRVEEFLARHARKIATPAGARELKNPYPSTSESLAEARAHWVEHCALCHGLDGSGDTVIGRNLYPKASDVRDAQTQALSDGELFYVISNGVRFTGMPAWGDEDEPEEIWKLVLLIRRLPGLPPEELQEMQKMAEPVAGEAAGEGRTHSHSHPPGTKPHKD